MAHVCDWDGFQNKVQYQAAGNHTHWGNLFAPSGLASIVCGVKGGDPELLTQAEQLFAASLDKCAFDGGGGGSSTVVAWEVYRDDKSNRISDIYESLAQWSGLS